MNSIQIQGLFLNLILYIIIVFPIYVLTLIPQIYTNKKNFICVVFISIVIESIISIFLYNYTNVIFHLFSKTQGIINYAVYAFKILFIPSSLYSIKILVPIYLIRKNDFSLKKKLHIFHNRTKEDIMIIAKNKTICKYPRLCSMRQINEVNLCAKLPKALYYRNFGDNSYNIKIAILFFSKIAITILFIIIGYVFFNTKGLLFAIPLVDFIYILVYIFIFLYIIR